MSEVKRRLRLITAGFAVGAVVVIVALSLVSFEAESPELKGATAVTATVFGAIGLIVALRWWTSVDERMNEPSRLQVGFIVRVAIAEVGLLMGILGFVMSGSMLAPLIGGALFLGALAAMTLGLHRLG
jgi:hypothetical protein